MDAYGCPAERVPPGADVIGFVDGAPYGCAERVPPGAEVIGLDEEGGAPYEREPPTFAGGALGCAP